MGGLNRIRKTVGSAVTNSFVSQKIGRFAGHTVKQIKSVASGAAGLGGGIGRRIGNFFRPDAAAAAKNTNTAQKQAFDPACNAPLNQPFSKDVATDFCEILRFSIKNDEKQKPVEVTVKSNMSVVKCSSMFVRDLIPQTNALSLNGEPVAMGGKENEKEKAGNWASFLIASGVSEEDLLPISQVCNQAAFGTYAQICANSYKYHIGECTDGLSGDSVIPMMQLPDGDIAAIAYDCSQRNFNVVPKESGYDIEIEAKGQMSYLHTVSSRTIFLDPDQSSLEQHFTIELRRDDGSQQLEVVGFRGCNTVNAVTEDGTRLTPRIDFDDRDPKTFTNRISQ